MFLSGFWRRRKLARHALDDADWERACRRFLPLRAMDATARQRLRELVTLFLADKIVAPSAGYGLRADQRIEIGVWACLPILELGLKSYRSFRGVIVYPDEFLAPREEADEAGVVHAGYEQVAGESWDAGPILLSWADVREGRACDGYNVVIHECAHKLDLLDGEVNGVPGLVGSGISAAEWRTVMSAAWERVGREEEETGSTPIDAYALESPAEFFAVLSEQFFTGPHDLAAVLPDVYALLARYYRLDPRAWYAVPSAAADGIA